MRGGGCVLERGEDVLALQIGIVGSNLIDARARGKLAEHRADGDAGVADAGKAAHPIRVDGDSLLGDRARYLALHPGTVPATKCKEKSGDIAATRPESGPFRALVPETEGETGVVQTDFARFRKSQGADLQGIGEKAAEGIRTLDLFPFPNQKIQSFSRNFTPRVGENRFAPPVTTTIARSYDQRSPWRYHWHRFRWERQHGIAANTAGQFRAGPGRKAGMISACRGFESLLRHRFLEPTALPFWPVVSPKCPRVARKWQGSGIQRPTGAPASRRSPGPIRICGSGRTPGGPADAASRELACGRDPSAATIDRVTEDPLKGALEEIAPKLDPGIDPLGSGPLGRRARRGRLGRATAGRFSMRLERIVVQAFRGYPDRAEIMLSGDVVLLAGENGTGKTSLTEAFEWVLFDSIVRKGRSKTRGEYQGSGWIRSVHAQPDAETFAEVTLNKDGRRHVVRRILVGNGTELTIDGKPAADVKALGLRTEDAFRPFLGQCEIQALIDSEQQSRWEQLERDPRLRGLRTAARAAATAAHRHRSR